MLLGFVVVGIVIAVIAAVVFYMGPETFLAKVFGTKHARDVKAMMPLVAAINALEPQMEALTNEELAGQTADRVRKYPRGIEVYLVKGVSDEVVCLRVRIKHSSSDG